MRDLAKLLELVSSYTHSDLVRNDTLSVIDYELKLRQTMALERIATALEHANEQNDALLNLGPRYARSDA